SKVRPAVCLARPLLRLCALLLTLGGVLACDGKQADTSKPGRIADTSSQGSDDRALIRMVNQAAAMNVQPVDAEQIVGEPATINTALPFHWELLREQLLGATRLKRATCRPSIRLLMSCIGSVRLKLSTQD